MLARELLAGFGGTEILLAFFYAIWLVSLGTGAFLARRRLAATTAFLPLSCVLLTLPPWLIALARLSPSILGLTAGEISPWWGPLAVVVATMIPLGLVAGALFPLAASFFREGPRATAMVGYLYMAEAGGSLVAGILASFWLLDRANSFVVLLPFTGIFAAGLISVLRSVSVRRPLVWRIVLLLVLFHALSWTSFNEHVEQKRWGIIGGGAELAWSGPSQYGQIHVGLLQDRNTFYSNGELLFSCPPDPLELIEAETMLLLPEDVQTVLVSGNPASPIRAAQESIEVILLEQDPVLAHLAMSLCPPGMARPIKDDLHTWLREYRSPIDLLVVHAPEPLTAAANRYYTREFFKLAARNLSPGGIFALPAHLPAALLTGHRFSAAKGIYHDLTSIFGSVVVSPGPGGWFFSSPDSSFSLDAVAKRIGDSPGTGPIARANLEIVFPRSRTDEVRKMLEESSSPRPNTDRHPSAYIAQLRVWLERTGLRTTVSSSSFRIVVGLTALMLLAVASYWSFWRGKSTRIYCGGVIASTGFVAFSVSLLLLLGFQHVAGSLFNRLAALTGLYMAGLSLGAYIGSRKALPVPLLDLLIAVLVLVCALTVPIVHQTAFFYVMSFLLATLAGAQFPSAIALMINAQHTARLSAGFLDAADHLGASLGAATVGLILLPGLGFGGAFVLLAALKLLSALSRR